MLYVRLAAKDVPSAARKKSRGVGIGAAIGASAAVFGLMVVALVIWRRKGQWFAHTAGNAQVRGIGVIAFRYADLQRATKNFSERLGGGGFGSVFKGYLSDSFTLVAVKRLDGIKERSSSGQK